MKRFIYLMMLGLLFVTSRSSAQDIGQMQVSSVRINSITVDDSLGSSHIKFLIQGRKPGKFEAVQDARKAVQKTLEYFFIALIMRDEAFWVDLNPNDPASIINTALGGTDMGRIILGADLRLKEDLNAIIDPESSKIGKEFWDRLYAKAVDLGVLDVPVVTRLWIVPGETTAYQDDKQFSIVKSSLKVRLEAGHLEQKKKSGDIKQQELEDFVSDLIGELVAPELNKMVNEAYGYADLREVYSAIVVAQWYKHKFNPYTDPLLKAVDFEVVKDAELTYSYSPEGVYQEYVRSLGEGKNSFSEREGSEGFFSRSVVTKRYSSGGIDFTKARAVNVEVPPVYTDEEGVLFTCDLLIPQNNPKFLRYAKAHAELTPGYSSQGMSPVLLAKNLPAIAPEGFASRRIKSLDHIDRTDRLLLGKL